MSKYYVINDEIGRARRRVESTWLQSAHSWFSLHLSTSSAVSCDIAFSCIKWKFFSLLSSTTEKQQNTQLTLPLDNVSTSLPQFVAGAVYLCSNKLCKLMDYSSISIQLALIKRSNMQRVVQFRCNLILVLRELEFVIRLTFFVMTRSSLRAPSRPKNNKKTHSFKFKIFPQQTNILSELQRECCLCDRIGFEQFRYIIYNFSRVDTRSTRTRIFGLHVELLLVVITFSRERATLFRVPKFSLTSCWVAMWNCWQISCCRQMSLEFWVS